MNSDSVSKATDQREMVMNDMIAQKTRPWRSYKAGYDVFIETFDWGDMKRAYTPAGDYIGNPKDAHFLCKKKGIAPERAKGTHTICSIGFCETEQKWYGWSHRAIFGFEVGSTVKPGDCGYQPSDKEDFRADCVRFWSGEYHGEVEGHEETQDGELGVQVNWKYTNDVPNEKVRGGISGVFSPYPDEFGRGEWVAETMDDARQMAVDFAEDVS